MVRSFFSSICVPSSFSSKWPIFISMRTNQHTPPQQQPDITASDIPEEKQKRNDELWVKYCFPHVVREAERICANLKLSPVERRAVLAGQWEAYAKKWDKEWLAVRYDRDGVLAPRGNPRHSLANMMGEKMSKTTVAGSIGKGHIDVAKSTELQPATERTIIMNPGPTVTEPALDINRGVPLEMDKADLDTFTQNIIITVLRAMLKEHGLDPVGFYRELQQRVDAIVSI